MRSLLAIAAAPLAFAGAPYTSKITSAEAVRAMTVQIHRQTAARLRGGYHGETLCSGQGPGQQPISATTRLARWHCTLELSGARFPAPCKAEAYVSATGRPQRVRIDWVAMSRYCHDGTG
jgi:hypothetical protein